MRWLIAFWRSFFPQRKRLAFGTWSWACAQRVPVGYYYGSFFMPLNPREADRFRQALRWATLKEHAARPLPLRDVHGYPLKARVVNE